MSTGIGCPGCGRAISERRLRVQVITIESCPHCGDPVRRADRLRWTDDDAALQQDVSAVDAWLEALARGNGLSVERTAVAAGGTWRWPVAGATSWTCEIVYETDRPGVIALRLSSERNAPATAADFRRLAAACSSRGVETYCSREPSGRWGAQQYLSTTGLNEGVFWPVLRRLTEAMYDAVLEFADRTPSE
jgi:hypothetical protein